MEETIKDLRKRILPILLHCQANRGDLAEYDEWKNKKDAVKKLYYTYYSGLFCRILYVMETGMFTPRFVNECNILLDKYHWYNIQSEDLEKFTESKVTYYCEVKEALDFIPGIDDVIWEKCFSEDYYRYAPCQKWSFADVRGTIQSSVLNRKQ